MPYSGTSSTALFHMVAGGPRPVAPFSHAVEIDVTVFITGQMPDTPDTPGTLPDGMESQTRNVMANLRVVLAGIGLGFEHVVVARAFLTNFQRDYAAFNATLRQPSRLFRVRSLWRFVESLLPCVAGLCASQEREGLGG